MFPRIEQIVVPLTFLAPLTLSAADYTYQQTTQITGGSLLKMMKTMGVFSSQARHIGDPIVSTIYLKDNRLANVGPDSMEIIDLDKQTITQIDVQKKTYTVMTFDQMKQAIERARAEIGPLAAKGQSPPESNPNAEKVQMSFDVKVRSTGAQKEISGLESTESILTMTMNATDTQTQQTGSMAITNDMWMVPSIPGYDQVRDFYKRFAAEMSDATIGLGFDFSKMLARNPAAGQALSDMAGELEKLSGVPILQVMRMGTTVNGQPLPAASEAPAPEDSGPRTPSAGQVAKAGVSSMISSRLGGFGFGKKKNNPPPDPNAGSRQAAPPPEGAILMETQITTSNFSSAAVDPSHFDIPAGYKQVQPPATPYASASVGATPP